MWFAQESNRIKPAPLFTPITAIKAAHMYCQLRAFTLRIGEPSESLPILRNAQDKSWERGFSPIPPKFRIVLNQSFLAQ